MSAAPTEHRRLARSSNWRPSPDQKAMANQESDVRAAKCAGSAGESLFGLSLMRGGVGGLQLPHRAMTIVEVQWGSRQGSCRCVEINSTCGTLPPPVLVWTPLSVCAQRD